MPGLPSGGLPGSRGSSWEAPPGLNDKEAEAEQGRNPRALHISSLQQNPEQQARDCNELLKGKENQVKEQRGLGKPWTVISLFPPGRTSELPPKQTEFSESQGLERGRISPTLKKGSNFLGFHLRNFKSKTKQIKLSLSV